MDNEVDRNESLTFTQKTMNKDYNKMDLNIPLTSCKHYSVRHYENY